jgi:hypothetical protein
MEFLIIMSARMVKKFETAGKTGSYLIPAWSCRGLMCAFSGGHYDDRRRAVADQVEYNDDPRKAAKEAARKAYERVIKSGPPQNWWRASCGARPSAMPMWRPGAASRGSPNTPRPG